MNYKWNGKAYCNIVIIHRKIIQICGTTLSTARSHLNQIYKSSYELVALSRLPSRPIAVCKLVINLSNLGSVVVSKHTK